jgi:hypothetical protein
MFLFFLCWTLLFPKQEWPTTSCSLYNSKRMVTDPDAVILPGQILAAQPPAWPRIRRHKLRLVSGSNPFPLPPVFLVKYLQSLTYIDDICAKY